MFVVHAEEMEDGGVEVVNVDAILGDGGTDLIGAAVDGAGRTPAPASQEEKHAL